MNGKTIDFVVFDEADQIAAPHPYAKLTSWFLLYGGSSEDGMGPPVYKGRTIHPDAALTFYRKNIKNNPYSTGNVTLITDKEERQVTEENLKAMVQIREKASQTKVKEVKQKKAQETNKPAGYGSFA